MSADQRDEHTEVSPGWRAGQSRRTFLRRGTFTAAAVAVAGSVPGLTGLMAASETEAPAVDTGVNEVEDDAGALSEPLVAQVKDARTGEISLFQGEREVVVRSPALARSLMSAARPKP